jgi:hypothetical protein
MSPVCRGRESDRHRVTSGQRVRPVVVGVVKDIRDPGLDAPAHGSAFLVARTTSDQSRLAPALARLVHNLAPSLPIRPPMTRESAVAPAAAPRAAAVDPVVLMRGK